MFRGFPMLRSSHCRLRKTNWCRWFEPTTLIKFISRCSISLTNNIKTYNECIHLYIIERIELYTLRSISYNNPMYTNGISFPVQRCIVFFLSSVTFGNSYKGNVSIICDVRLASAVLKHFFYCWYSIDTLYFK